MDLHHLSILFGIVAVIALCVVAWLVWRDGQEAKRVQDETAARMRAAQREVTRRPRVAAITTPIPNLKGTTT